MCVCVHTHTHTHTQVCVCVCVCTHTHTHTHTRVLLSLKIDIKTEKKSRDIYLVELVRLVGGNKSKSLLDTRGSLSEDLGIIHSVNISWVSSIFRAVY